jgi:predicted ribosomally synthesized peptide with SipW-like signal peptide
MTDKKYELSRRKALLGLGTIGAAGAAAGMGTSALFSDEESFTDNLIEAGTLDLSVELKLVDTSDEFNKIETSGGTLSSEGESITINGDESTDANGGTVAASSLSLNYTDVKPGDWWVLCKTVSIDGNPAYVNETYDPDAGDVGDKSTDENTNDGGENPEPEPGPDNGELGYYLRVHEGDDYNEDRPGDLNDGATTDGVGDNGNVAYNFVNTGAGNIGSTAISLDGDGTIEFGPGDDDPSPDPSDGPVNDESVISANPANLIFQGNLNHFLFAHSADMMGASAPAFGGTGSTLPNNGVAGWNGITIKNPGPADIPPGNYTDPPAENTGSRNATQTVNGSTLPVNHTAAGAGYGFNQGDNPLTEVGDDGDVNDLVVYQKFFIPKEVGNVIQGDSIKYTYRARAQQVRNNEPPIWEPAP